MRSGVVVFSFMSINESDNAPAVSVLMVKTYRPFFDQRAINPKLGPATSTIGLVAGFIVHEDVRTRRDGVSMIIISFLLNGNALLSYGAKKSFWAFTSRMVDVAR